jgi:hypothetical protein
MNSIALSQENILPFSEEELERCKTSGNRYSQIIDHLAWGKTIEPLTDSHDPLLSIAQAAILSLRRQQIDFTLQKWGGLELMKQAFGDAVIPPNAELRLENPSEGIFIVRISHEAYRQLSQLRTDSGAVTVKLTKGISFIIAPTHKNAEIDKRLDAENIPHEINHLLWHLGKASKIIASNEEDPVARKAFLQFREEVIASIMGDSVPFGYHGQNKYRTEGSEANELLREIFQLILQSPFKISDLILPIAETRNFNELRHKLADIKAIIEKKVILPNKDPLDWGWNSVPTL